MSERGASVRWVRPSVTALLVGTAVLYLWRLDDSGWANAFYSAAAQAGGQSWKSLFFGSSDWGDSITVDKAPASLWLMGLSVRVFGLSSWSILVPQALCGVAAVGLLYLAVGRWFGPIAGLLAAGTMALQPVAVMMFRFNDPDALLVLLLVAAGYAGVRAVEKASTWWLVLAGALVGFGFLAKMTQALLVVPGFAIAYLVAAPTSPLRRLGQLLASGAAMFAAAAWWVVLVDLIPASSRPYVGGSQHNSALELALGYNGFGRLTGEEVGSVGGGGRHGGWGLTGLGRLFNPENGGGIAWLLPAALILVIALAAVTWRAPRSDRTRAALLIWGGWLVVTWLTFSLMGGIFHSYYNIALAPGIGAVIGIGGVVLARRRDLGATLILAVAVVSTALCATYLLNRTQWWHPWLAPTLVWGSLLAAVLLVLARHAPVRWPAWAEPTVLVVALVASLGGTVAAALVTASTPHTGATPVAGPGGGSPGGLGGLTAGAAGRNGARPLVDAEWPGPALVALMRSHSDQYRWVAAAIGSNTAAGLQLGAGVPVMAIGGFNGSDPAPTLEQFQEDVREGRIHFFVGGGGFANSTGSRAAVEIFDWVTTTFAKAVVDGAPVYDLQP